MARERRQWQRASRDERRYGGNSQGRTGLGVSRRAGDQDGVLVVTGFLRHRLSRNGRAQSLAIPAGRFFFSERGGGDGALSGGGRRQSCRSRPGCFAQWERTSRHGYWRRNRHLRSSRELAERFEAYRDTAPQSGTNTLDLMIADARSE